MPNASGLRMYRTIHSSKAQNLEDASAQVILYFASLGYESIEILDSGINALGHYDFKCTAGNQPTPTSRAVEESPSVVKAIATVERLTCEKCASEFSRPIVRGRKPRFCPSCVAVAPQPPKPTTESEVTETASMETFTCQKCWNTFNRPIVRGRKPSLCPTCKGS